VARADAVLARMRAVLDKMMELESYNEVIELLRGVIRTQEEIRTETLKRQRQRAKEALERP
jgi:precorrin-3B methylase